MDNRIFSVNGSGLAMLTAALDLVRMQEGNHTKFKGYVKHKTAGLILLWHTDGEGAVPFMSPPSPGELARQIIEMFEKIEDESNKEETWFNIEALRNGQIKHSRWEKDYTDGDVSTSLGWRVYCEDWGHVANNHYAICAVRPAYMWHGK